MRVVEGSEQERKPNDSTRDKGTADHEDPIANTSTGDRSKTCLSSELSDCTKPYQPHPQCIETQTIANTMLTLQSFSQGSLVFLLQQRVFKSVLFWT